MTSSPSIPTLTSMRSLPRPDVDRDRRFMALALALAERGRGRTNPNPLVGAVLVSPDGVVVGQGAHLLAGGPHAEVHAITAAGSAARGATLYCTLEPCCHVGRTGPCVERIAEAGVSRVVTALEDPNPLVAGKGHQWLRDRGIEVLTGVHTDAAARQNAPFLTWITRRRPWTLLKTVLSSDGVVAPVDAASGPQPLRLTGVETDRWMHRQRAWVDAIAVGAATVLTDDPWLTPRGAWRPRPFVRVIVDWRGRVPPTARVYSTTPAGPVIMVGLDSVPAETVSALKHRGIEVDLYAARDLVEVGHRLAARGVQSLLVEGGPVLQQAWCDTGCVDAVQWVDTATPAGAGVAPAPALVAWKADGNFTRRQSGADVILEGAWS